MRVIFISLSLIFSSLSHSAIYGKDNRKEIFQSPIEIREAASSVAAMIPKALIKKTRSSDLTVVGDLYKDASFITEEDEDVLAKYFKMDMGNVPVCKGVRFYAQRTAADCTTFLVSDDLIMTAGHCTDELFVGDVCEDYVFIFDYYAEHNFHSKMIIDPKNVYQCEKVQYSSALDSMDPSNWTKTRDEWSRDFAIIKLSRKVKDRSPLKVSTNFRYKANSPVYTLGTPYGLPIKFSGLGWILDNSVAKNSFVTNLDTFKGNSGSPVFNARTNEVIGILVSGSEDFNEVELSDRVDLVRKGHAVSKGATCFEPAVFDNYSSKEDIFQEGSEGEVVFRIDRVFGAF